MSTSISELPLSTDWCHMSGKRACFIRSIDGDWLQIPDCSIDIEIRRRLTREVVRGHEGDDIVDEGAESAEYTVKGVLDDPTYLRVMSIFRSGQPYFIEPFDEKEIKVAISHLKLNGDTGEFELTLIEDRV